MILLMEEIPSKKLQTTNQNPGDHRISEPSTVSSPQLIIHNPGLQVWNVDPGDCLQVLHGHAKVASWKWWWFRWPFCIERDGWKGLVTWLFPKLGYPQIIHFNRVFHYKPSILGYPYFWKHPDEMLLKFDFECLGEIFVTFDVYS